jgi:hypothetical protein
MTPSQTMAALNCYFLVSEAPKHGAPAPLGTQTNGYCLTRCAVLCCVSAGEV